MMDGAPATSSETRWPDWEGWMTDHITEFCQDTGHSESVIQGLLIDMSEDRAAALDIQRQALWHCWIGWLASREAGVDWYADWSTWYADEPRRIYPSLRKGICRGEFPRQWTVKALPLPLETPPAPDVDDPSPEVTPEDVAHLDSPADPTSVEAPAGAEDIVRAAGFEETPGILPLTTVFEAVSGDMKHTCDNEKNGGGDGECLACGVRDCPHGEPLHYHHDGCPACYQDAPVEAPAYCGVCKRFMACAASGDGRVVDDPVCEEFDRTPGPPVVIAPTAGVRLDVWGDEPFENLEQLGAGLTDEDKETRRTRLTASDWAVVVGHSPWSSPIELYRRKVDGFETSGNAATSMGTKLEPFVVGLYREWLAEKGVEYGSMHYPVSSMGHISEDWIGATPDVLLHLKGGVTQIAQIKTTSQYWPTVPDHVIDQVHIEWLVVDSCLRGRVSRIVDVPVFSAYGGFNFRVLEVEINLEYLEKLKELGRQWWHRHVVAKVPPPIDETDLRQVKLRYPRDKEDDFAQASPRSEALLERLVTIERKARILWELKDQVKASMLADIGTSSGLEFAGGHRMTARVNKHGTRVFRTNVSKLMEE